MEDKDYMALACSLAERGRGWTSPNPMVGAVIVKDGRIVGQGWHRRWGGPHAEREALADCAEPPAGAVLYVTLEPCCHQGRQPPCTDAILEAGIARVVIGSSDPNPLVAGKGIEILRARGVAVETGVLKETCDALNPFFFHYITTKRPYVTMKYAMTLDGKIATRTGASRWITGEAARARVHRDRHAHAAIMAGARSWLTIPCSPAGWRGGGIPCGRSATPICAPPWTAGSWRPRGMCPRSWRRDRRRRSGPVLMRRRGVRSGPCP